ncbi:Conserved_hypothetical protein [Hexamita inflata]|uniref:Uncharacterized protein n=1 Tax=Hexamita inflata TaxID=28002 RepID=A0AA86U8Y2_9EUKA|nr:Conserved hypothetical protein [Hexamita inflata]CAI9945894.1 Conserved hypothetical protein [Hexamita inflata]
MLLPPNLSTDELEYLCNAVKMISISVQLKFTNKPDLTEFTPEIFTELASKFKNVAYPQSLVSTKTATRINEECLMLSVPQGYFRVFLWKRMSLKIEGDLRLVLSAIPSIKKAILVAIHRCTKTLLGLKAEFGEERMDNLIASDGIRMGSHGSDGVDQKTLWQTLKVLQQRYGADYTFKDDISAGSKACYQIEIKVISKERGKLNVPRLKVTSDSIHIMGGLPLQMVLHFRKRFQECYLEVTGKHL